MDPHYLVMLGRPPSPLDGEAWVPREFGLREVDTGAAAPLHVFTSQEAPTIEIPGIGVLVGHLFDLDGKPASDEQARSLAATGPNVEAALLRRFWGEYVLIRVDGNGVRITRDPTGGVPCFYRIRHGQGFVTSSVSLVERLGLYKRRPDWAAVIHRLSYPWRRTEQTPLLDLRELLPGCALRVSGPEVGTTVEWSPWSHIKDGRYSDAAEAAAAVRRAVSTAVVAWAETDGNILLELSGGLDSSIVGVCLPGANTRVTCCTIMAPVRGTDERQYARQVADRLAVDLHTVELDLEDARYDFPVSPDTVAPGMGILHYMVDQAMGRAGELHGVCSYFSGGGGDTVFCYLKGASPAADAFRERGAVAGLMAVQDLADLHGCTVWKAGRLTLRKLWRGAKSPHSADTAFLDPRALVDRPEPHPWLDAPGDMLPGDLEKVFALAATQSYRDGMMRTERRPMRFPLLSQPVMEACLRVPTWMWFTGGQNRAVARSAFADLLPRDVRLRRSKGTYVAYCAALYNRTKQGMLDFLAAGQIRAQGLLDMGELERFVSAEIAPEDFSFMRIMDLCMIENWVRQQH